jgi:uncharacterized protein YukE
MASTSGLTLTVDPSKYQQTVTTLQSKVSNLQDLVSSYETEKKNIDDVWTGNEATKYKQVIENDINAVNKTITTTQEYIKQIQELMNQKNYTELDISNTIDEQLAAAKSVFD